MDPEQKLWNHLKKKMRGKWDAQRHEDRYSSGVPDVSYALSGVDGWIELKAVPEWPKRDSTPIRIGLEPHQATWAENRGGEGSGYCFVLAQIGREYFLIHWGLCRVFTKPVDQRKLYELSVRHWKGSIDADELQHELAKRRR